MQETHPEVPLFSIGDTPPSASNCLAICDLVIAIFPHYLVFP